MTKLYNILPLIGESESIYSKIYNILPLLDKGGGIDSIYNEIQLSLVPQTHKRNKWYTNTHTVLVDSI